MLATVDQASAVPATPAQVFMRAFHDDARSFDPTENLNAEKGRQPAPSLYRPSS